MKNNLCGRGWWIPLILSTAFFLRILGVDFGLPDITHPDEPHYVNIAAYFGSGDLNPHVFKYPTLWMYLLSAGYGVYYLLWSGFGLFKSPSDFAGMFVYDPTYFYLIARTLSAILGTVVVYLVYRLARKVGHNYGAY